MSSRPEFVAVWAYLTAAFAKDAGSRLSEEESARRMEAYFQSLSDLPPDLLKAAALMVASKNVWFPAIAEIRSAAYEIMAEADGLPTPTEAWAEVKVNTGKWQPSWSHPMVKRALDMIGERDWAMSDRDDEPSWRARYIQTYTDLLTRERSAVTMLPAVRQVVARLADSKHKRLRGGESCGATS